MPEKKCIFCSPSSDLEKNPISGKLGYVSWDTYPANPGHILIIPYRHFPDYFDATQEERAELWELVSEAKAIIDEKFSPDGYNVGINVGQYGGQSIPHLHIHLIPRFAGDVENPKGGVRGVIPHRQKYQKRSD